MELERDNLDAKAAEAGVEEPEKLPNKQAVAEAVLAAAAQKEPGFLKRLFGG